MSKHQRTPPKGVPRSNIAAGGTIAPAANVASTLVTPTGATTDAPPDPLTEADHGQDEEGRQEEALLSAALDAALDAALALPGAMRAADAPWLPMPRFSDPEPLVVRFLALLDFKHDGRPQRMGEPFDVSRIDDRQLRRMVQARFVHMEVLHAAPPRDHY